MGGSKGASSYLDIYRNNSDLERGRFFQCLVGLEGCFLRRSCE
jgi:hypothetical protein